MKRSYDFEDEVKRIEKKHNVQVTTTLCVATTSNEETRELSAGGCFFDVTKRPTSMPSTKEILKLVNIENHDVVIKSHKLSQFSTRFQIRRQRIPVQDMAEFKPLVHHKALAKEVSVQDQAALGIAPLQMGDVYEKIRLVMKLARGLECITLAIREYGKDEGEWYSHVERVCATSILIRAISWQEYGRARCVRSFVYPCTPEEKIAAERALVNSQTWDIKLGDTFKELRDCAQEFCKVETVFVLEARFEPKMDEEQMDRDHCELRKAWITLPTYSKDILLNRDMLFQTNLDFEPTTLFVAIPLR